MKKFVLINSPLFWERTDEEEEYLSPLGIGYIATYLKKAGLEVTLLDSVKERLGVEDILKQVSEIKPEFVGINVFTQNYELVKYIIEKMSIQCECFVGGQVVKSIYETILDWQTSNKINIIIGEGELIIPAIVLENCEEKPIEYLDNKFVYKVDRNSQYFPEDISNIYLDRSFLKNEIINNHYGEKEAAIITSRGCAYDCAFCGGARGLNKDISIRMKDVESVKYEIAEICDLYPDLQSIRILDDLFLRNETSISQAADIFKKFPQLHWRGMVHVLSLIYCLDKVKLLKNCNCKELFIGIESGSNTIRKRINKLGDISSVIAVIRELLINGIDVKGYFMYGFPDETQEDMEETYKLACELRNISEKCEGTFRPSVFQFRPYHGTKLYNEILEKGIDIPKCHYNPSIYTLQGRSQFNFCSGNYSRVPDELLEEYIVKTQKIMEA
ncbi:MAG: radical SAM protein [Lachnobacterium sp.]|nr:radical SAM protein [Lachnobacterium sp.]